LCKSTTEAVNEIEFSSDSWRRQQIATQTKVNFRALRLTVHKTDTNDASTPSNQRATTRDYASVATASHAWTPRIKSS